MLEEVESDLVERKESWQGDSLEKGRLAVCAFAYDPPDHRRPGVIFVGVKDNGIPTGLAILSQFLQTLANVKTDGKIVPPPTLVVEKRLLMGIEIATMTVHQHGIRLTRPVKAEDRWVNRIPSVYHDRVLARIFHPHLRRLVEFNV